MNPTEPVIAAPHAATVDAVTEALATSSDGLTHDQAAERARRYGPNQLEAQPHPSFVALLWEAVTEPFVILLALAGVLAIAVGDPRDGVLVLVGLLPIVGADFVTSYRGERALEALREAAAPHARVRREGAVNEIEAAQIVPGDVVLLDVGDVVPADIRLSRVDGMQVDRSVLTGESIPEAVSSAPDPPETPIVERRAMAYSGTSVVLGRGEGIAVAIGTGTELGRIASGLGRRERRRSPIQKELDRLVRILLVVAVSLIVITVGAALLRGEPIAIAVVAGITAAIAAIPEEPPVLLAVILGLGAYRLLRRGVLVRRLSAQETLSAVDLILTDKTGTLTRNELALEAVLTPAGDVAPHQDRAELVAAAYRSQDDSWHVGRGGRIGSFARAFQRELERGAGTPTLDPDDLLTSESASGAHPYTRTVAVRDGQREELVLGAPEIVLDLMADSATSSWRTLISTHAEAGHRLVLLGRGMDDGPMSPAALFSFADPLRSDIPEALQTAAAAGIQTVVVTGDHALTAARIARAAGIAGGRVVVGEELAAWDDERLGRELPSLAVVARASPDQKLRLVDVARRLGRTVAVTGDGVNDSLALEHADVGVAMGSGTQVAREASDLVLGDDSFATLMAGLREGRRMVANITKGLIFLLTTHVALLGYVLIATIYGVSQPLLPIHILWIEFFIDVSASIAFEREPEEPGLMGRRPRRSTTPLLPDDLLGRIVAAGSWTALGALFMVAMHGDDLEHGRWLAFNVLVFGQAVRAYANRSLDRPLIRLRRNGFLLLVCLVAALVQLAIPYVPVLAGTFGATPLSIDEMLLIALIALAPAVLAEMVRAWRGATWVA